MTCKHHHITIRLELACNASLTSLDLATGAPYLIQSRPLQFGPIRYAGYWSRAHLLVRCHDCGYENSYASDDWRTYPQWLVRHWQQLVAAGGLAEQIQTHFHMFEEPAP